MQGVQQAKQIKPYSQRSSWQSLKKRRQQLQNFTQCLTHVFYKDQIKPDNNFCFYSAQLATNCTTYSKIRCVIELTYLLHNANIQNCVLEVKFFIAENRMIAIYEITKQKCSPTWLIETLKNLYEQLWKISPKTEKDDESSLLNKFKKSVQPILAYRSDASSLIDHIQKTELFQLKSMFLRIYESSILSLDIEDKSINELSKLDNLKIRWLIQSKRLFKADSIEQVTSIINKCPTVKSAYNYFFHNVSSSSQSLKKIDFRANLRDFLLMLGWTQPQSIPQLSPNNTPHVSLFFTRVHPQPLVYHIRYPHSLSHLTINVITDLQYPTVGVSYIAHNSHLIAESFTNISLFQASTKQKKNVAFRLENHGFMKEPIADCVIIIQKATIAVRLLKPLLKTGEDLRADAQLIKLLVRQYNYYSHMVEKYYRTMVFKNDIFIEQ